jgi:mannose-6-phosphate isomerase-like protein (cupin superfamily)
MTASSIVADGFNENGPWYDGTVGERIALRVSSLDTNGAYAVVESVAAPGCSPPLHVHRHEDEHFVVLAGHYRFVCEDRSLDAAAGSSFTVPRGARHSWRNLSDTPGRLLVVLTPGGFERCIQEVVGRPKEQILEIAARYGCTIVGPPIEP